jgi:hypothetical protein
MMSTEKLVNDCSRRTWSQCNPKRTTKDTGFTQLI